MAGRNARAAAVVVVLSVISAACGSTVPPSARDGAALSASDPAAVEEAQGFDSGETTSGFTTGSPSSGTPRRSVTGGATGSRGGGSTALGTTAASPKGSIQIGVAYLASRCAYYRTAGADALGCVDEKAAYEAVIKDVNATGGLAGHRLEPKLFEMPNQSDESAQAACAHFTQDNHVAAVITGTAAGRIEVLRSCLARAKTPLFDLDSTPIATEKTFRQTPLYVMPIAPTLERFARLYVDGLLSQGFLSGRWNAHPSCSAETKPRLGLVSFDRPEYREVHSTVLGPRFAAKGHPVEEVAYVTYTEDLGRAAADAQAAVLRFASRCVDHVVFLDTGAPAMLFANEASSQGYTPRYGYSSPTIPAVVQSIYTNPRVQLRGAVGVGWCPICEVLQPNWDATAKRPGAARCDALLAAANVDKQGPAGEFYALRVCEAGYFLQAAAKASTSISGVGLVEGAGRLGDTYQPIVTYRTSLSATKRDGASGFRNFAFVDECACWRYTSDVQPF